MVGALNPEMNYSVPPIRQYNVTQLGEGRIVMSMTDSFKSHMQKGTVSQSVEVLRRRIDEFGI